MARRRSAAAKIVRFAAPRAAAPIIRIAAPRASPKKRRRGGRRRAGGGLVGGMLGTPISEGVGGALVGFAVKQGWLQKLPAIPVVGRMGTAAIALHWWARRGGGEYVRRAATAAAVIAGYQLGSTGTIMGEGEYYGPPELDGDDEGDDE